MSHLYHCCAFTRETLPVDKGGLFEAVSLCGMTRLISWDFADNFVEDDEYNLGNVPRCEKCLNHPDLPLLLLGEMP